MSDPGTPQQQSLDEMTELRQRIAVLEAQLAQSQQAEADQQRIYNSLPVLVATAGLDGYYKKVNAAFERILGWSEQESLSCPFTDFIHPDDRAVAMQTFGKLKSGEPATDFVDRNVCKDGSHRWINWTVIPVVGRDIVFGIGQDITERRRAEEALQKAHRELERQVKDRTAELAVFQQFAEASGQGFGMADMEGRITYVNPALCRLFGEEKPEDVIGKHVSTYYPEDYKEKREHDIIFAVLRDGSWQGDQVVLSRHGTLIPTFQSSFLIRHENGKPFRLAAVVVDVAEPKRAEEALRASEEVYRTLVETSPDGVVMTDLNGRVTFASRKLLEMHGATSVDELLGRNSLAFVAHEDQKRFLANIRRTIEEGITRNIGYAFLRRNGTRIDGEVSAALLRDASGQPTGLVAIVRDIRDRKQAEEALERERQSLWRMLQASDHERQIISYDIHDGLAQYLASAWMQFQCHDALREKSPVEAKTAYNTAVELVHQAHVEARRLISDVRPPIIDEIGLETAISHLVHEQRQRGGPGIDVQCSVQFGRLAVILENALYRIVQEALGNACKHSQSKKVTVSLSQEGQEVCLKVQDWGVGFDPESVGAGHFGLEGIRQRVRLLGGRLTIESTPGSGTLIQVVVQILERHIEE
ncbi:MAG: PAS domain S-box protein [Rhodopirellula sp.]|nr:PAS domain S-box protein [Rhodopirellula sp.]